MRRYSHSTELLHIPIPIPAVSDREILYRAAHVTNDAGTQYARIAYSVEDERRPVAKGRVRIDSIALLLVREVEGSGGKRSQLYRMNSGDFKFGKMLGFVNKLASAKAGELIASPIVEMKRNVERLLKEYLLPPLAEVAYKGFNWNSKYDK